MDYIQIQDKIRKNFATILNDNYELKSLLLQIFVEGTAYIIGGYVRDQINNVPSRDIDIIIDLKHSRLIEFIKSSNLKYTINRHNGIKLTLNNLYVDIWSIEENWAFRENLVVLNEEDKLESIAKGCFYNYDALVVNLHTFNYNIRYYNKFKKTGILDILQLSNEYKILNPTSEANILRACWIKKAFNINFSPNLKKYIFHTIGRYNDQYGNYLVRLLEIKKRYPKYNDYLTSKDILNIISETKYNIEVNNQLLLDI